MAGVSNGDLVVIIPGILGSALSRNSRQTWGYKQVASNIYRLASQLTNDLALPSAAFRQVPDGYDDGTEIKGVMRTLGVVPGFWSIDGYDLMLSRLRSWFSDGLESVYEFPYDWRQSNEFTAGLLQRFVEPLVDRRRESVPDARLVLVGHSMGGLIARYYAECLDNRRLTRRVVTIGTPYQGAVKALLVLANGFVKVGPFKLELGDLARTLPSIAELLPAYDCLKSSGNLVPIGADALATTGLPEMVLERCLTFHARLNDAIAANGDERPTYHALLSHRQKTDVWAYVGAAGETFGMPSTDFEYAGDGTVPRSSATPPEWADDAQGMYIPGKHSSLQRQSETLAQLRGILTSRLRRAQAAVDEVVVDATSVVTVGESWMVEVDAVEGSTSLPLSVVIADPNEPAVEPIADVMLNAHGNGSYSASIPVTRTGIFRWTVHTPPAAAVAVDPISDILLCADS